LKLGFEFQGDFSLHLQGFESSKSYIATRISKNLIGPLFCVYFILDLPVHGKMQGSFHRPESDNPYL
jgi:hypothetical protein